MQIPAEGKKGGASKGPAARSPLDPGTLDRHEIPSRPGLLEWFLKEILAPLAPLLIALGIHWLLRGRAPNRDELEQQFLGAVEFAFFILVASASNIALLFELRPFVTRAWVPGWRLVLVFLFSLLVSDAFGLFPLYYQTAVVEEARAHFEDYSDTVREQAKRGEGIARRLDTSTLAEAPDAVQIIQGSVMYNGIERSTALVLFKEPQPFVKRVRVAVMVFDLVASLAIGLTALGIWIWHGRLVVAAKASHQ